MPLKNYLILMIISTLICWLSFGFVLFYLDPVASGMLALLLFYISLGLGLAGTFFLLGFVVRAIFQKNVPLFRHIGVSIRQAIFFMVLLVGSLVLQSARLLTWWNLLLFILFLIILEFFFLLRNSNYGR